MRRNKDEIEIIIPSKKNKKKLKKLAPEEIAERERNKFLLTDLAYNFANKGVDNKNDDEVIGFNYLRSVGGQAYSDSLRSFLRLRHQGNGLLEVFARSAERGRGNFRSVYAQAIS